MIEPDAGEDDLLAAVVGGERDENDPEVVALFARRPAARDRLERMRSVAADLDRAGAERRDLLTTREPVPRALQELVRAEVARWYRPRRPWGLVLAAALLVVTGLIAFVLSRPRAANPDDVLGPGSGDAHPVGVVAQYDEFRWNLDLPPHGWFDLVFFDSSDGGRELFRVSGITTPRWTPDSHRRSLMKDHMAWRVDAMDGQRVWKSAGPFVVQRR